ncbi:hypothetical protein ACIRD3_13505 [Kitasatospora sp. NPDC093550]|uniref:hypothetical protein n=1 Tax=Kitasatospora sp. NPDC093550 TaxID=3364089 RepID=UPI003805E142
MTARLRGPGPPPAAGASRAGVLRTGTLGLAGACALLIGGAAPAEAGGSLITVVDNSHADSWLEIDRAADLQNGSGSAGSDQDGVGALVGGLLAPGASGTPRASGTPGAPAETGAAGPPGLPAGPSLRPVAGGGP